MSKFYVDYRDSSGEICHVWCNASTASQAESIIKREYWDVETIVQVYQKLK